MPVPAKKGGYLTIRKEKINKVASASGSLLEGYLRRPYRILFLSLLVTLVASPIAAEYQLRTWPIELLLIVNLAVAAVGYGTARGRHRLLVVVTLTALLRQC
jgi:hypothetical protein